MGRLPPLTIKTMIYRRHNEPSRVFRNILEASWEKTAYKYSLTLTRTWRTGRRDVLSRKKCFTETSFKPGVFFIHLVPFGSRFKTDAAWERRPSTPHVCTYWTCKLKSLNTLINRSWAMKTRQALSAVGNAQQKKKKKYGGGRSQAVKSLSVQKICFSL